MNRHIEPKHVVTVMADCPKLFSDLPEIPADAALGEGYTFQP